jgi:hypothetical protein
MARKKKQQSSKQDVPEGFVWGKVVRVKSGSKLADAANIPVQSITPRKMAVVIGVRRTKITRFEVAPDGRVIEHIEWK